MSNYAVCWSVPRNGPCKLIPRGVDTAFFSTGTSRIAHRTTPTLFLCFVDASPLKRMSRYWFAYASSCWRRGLSNFRYPHRWPWVGRTVVSASVCPMPNFPACFEATIFRDAYAHMDCSSSLRIQTRSAIVVLEALSIRRSSHRHAGTEGHGTSSRKGAQALSQQTMALRMLFFVFSAIQQRIGRCGGRTRRRAQRLLGCGVRKRL